MRSMAHEHPRPHARRSRSTRRPGGASRPAACASFVREQGRGRAGRAPARRADELVPLPQGDPGAGRAGPARRWRSTFPGSGWPTVPTSFDYSWSGLAALDRRGDRRARDRPVPPGRPRHRRADRLRVGGAQPRPGALADRAQHDARASPAFRRPWSMRPFAIRGLGELVARVAAPAARFRELFYLQGIANRAATSRATRSTPTTTCCKRADGGRAFLRIMRGFELTEEKQRFLWDGLAERPYPARIVWGERDPALGPRPAAARPGGARASTTRSCCPPSTSSRRTRRSRSPTRSPTWPRRWARTPRSAGAWRAGPVLDQPRLAALRERDLDHVEVARRLGGRELLARLGQHLADVVARGDVDQGEQLHARLARQLGRLAGGRVAGLGGALDLLVGEARRRARAARPRARRRGSSRRAPCRR